MAASGVTEERRTRRLELGTGVLVLAALLAFVVFVASGRLGTGAQGTELRASFDHIDGLTIGSDVRIAGVKVGRVTGERIDPSRFLATVAFTVGDGITLPTDSSASIVSEGLLGGKYLAIVPGGSDTMLKPGGLITATQGSIGLEALLGKFISSVTGLMDAVKAQEKPGGAGHAAPIGGSLGP